MAYYFSHGRVAEAGPAHGRSTKSIEQDPLKWANSFAIVLAVATMFAIAVNFLSVYYRNRPAEALEEPESKIIYIAARPSAEPTPPPVINSMKLYACGGELGEDGFTMYVEDRPIEITLVMEPKMLRPPVYWSVSDDKAASLTVSDERTSCKFSALKPAGKIELTVRCYEEERVIPVYLWER